MWPDRRLIDLFGIEQPIIQAPMAGSSDADLAVEVAAAGGLGSLPADVLSPDALRQQFASFRARTDKPVNVNFSPLWSGQAVALGRDLPAGELTRALAVEAQAALRRFAG
jgi:nitronate monooxygenase